MKKIIQSFTLLCIFTSCQKQIDQLQSGGETPENGTVVSKTYLPLTKGTWWTYKVVEEEIKEPSTVTVLGSEKIIRGKVYVKTQVVKGSEKDTIYYNQTSDRYYMYTNNSGSGESADLELLFLYDDKPVGFRWAGNAGSADGLPARYTGKILEKNITLYEKGTSYSHVIHTQVQVQVRVLFYVTASIEDFYVAKGIGVVKNVSSVKLGTPSVTTSTITGFKIR